MRYYFNVRRGEALYEDHDGIDLRTLNEVFDHAHAVGREFISKRLLEGAVTDYRIEIADSAGSMIASLPLVIGDV